MNLIITIDTEADNWGCYNQTGYSLKNLERIPLLQNLFDEFKVRPTYLITYPVATDQRCIEMFRGYLDAGKCEIGMHCHPWNTPPFDRRVSNLNFHTMLCNLPEELQDQKLETLHEVICRNLGVVPVSFRAGRWGFGLSTARSLCRLGYRVDTSVTPYVSVKKYGGPDFSDFGPEPFIFYPGGNVGGEGRNSLLQVPATVGFLQPNFSLCHQLMQSIEGPVVKRLRLKGVLDYLGLLNKVWLSPELADANAMIRLAKRMETNHHNCLNMVFHSTSLVAGLSPFVKTKEDEQLFFMKIRSFLEFARESGWNSVTLAQFEATFKPPVIPTIGIGNSSLFAMNQSQAEKTI
ncbi:MAG: polysaccharide deacetylase family protein [Desulfuromonadales bacterium]|nr:polysaccharide deacetylase family protein [Desulfuromonadales bacterium]